MKQQQQPLQLSRAVSATSSPTIPSSTLVSTSSSSSLSLPSSPHLVTRRPMVATASLIKSKM